MPSKRESSASGCHRCADANVKRDASYKCLNCKTTLCSECGQNHMILRPCLDFRLVEMTTGRLIDSVFSLKPDRYETANGDSKITNNDEPQKGNRFQVERTFGKPIAHLKMQQSNTIQIPMAPSLHNFAFKKSSTQFENGNLRWRKADISTSAGTLPYKDDFSDTQHRQIGLFTRRGSVLQKKETTDKNSWISLEPPTKQGEFNENGDFFPVDSSNTDSKTKPSILKRSFSFKSEKSDSIWNMATEGSTQSLTKQNTKSQTFKKEVRFDTALNTVNEEPLGIHREYSNNFYHILEQQNANKTKEPPKQVKKILKKPKHQTHTTGLSMVGQSSIVIGPNETAGKISAALIINDKYLIVLDRINNKLKVFNVVERYQMVIDKKIPKGSWGLASPEDNIIAMTCRNKIVFYGLFEIKTSKYEKDKDPVLQPLDVEYTLKASCYGVSFCEARDLFFVACNVFFSDPCVFVVDTKGSTQYILRTIDDGISPFIPFSETLKVDSERGVLYIGDRFGKKIICTTYEGKLVWSVQLLGKPVSITTDKDHVYVCVNGKHISAIHKDGRFVKNLVDLDLDGRRICWHESSNHLVVLTKAFWGVSHFIQIYQL